MEGGGNRQAAEVSSSSPGRNVDSTDATFPTTELTVRRMSQSETWEHLKLRRISSNSSSSSFDIIPKVNDDDEDADADAEATTSLLEEGRSETIAINSPPPPPPPELVVEQKQLSVRVKSTDTTSTLSSSSANQIHKQNQRQSLLTIRSRKIVDKDKNNEVVCIINDPSTIHEAIISPDRLNALLACDDQVLGYEPRSWGFLIQCRGRNLRMITVPLLLLTLWGVLWICILSYVDSMSDVRNSIANLSSLISPLLVPVSFLLVFRLGRAAVRFWDARAAIGKIVELCRVLVSTAAVGLRNMNTTTRYQDDSATKNYDILLDEFARWTCAFPITVKNFLRPLVRSGWKEGAQETKRRFEFGQLLNEEEADAVLNTDDGNFGTIFVLNRLRELSWKAATCCSENNTKASDQKGPREMLYKQLNEQIDTLTGAWGACERINGTPLPLVYVIHLRTFLILYLMIWQMEAAASHGWVALPIVFAASWGLLGIEAAAVECERPFQWHSNHLALGKMCVVTSNNVAQTIRNIRGTSNRYR